MQTQQNYCFGYCLELLVPSSDKLDIRTLDEQQQMIGNFCRDKLSHLNFGGCYVDGHNQFRTVWSERRHGELIFLRSEPGDAIVVTSGYLLFPTIKLGTATLELLDTIGLDIYILDMSQPHANPHLHLAGQIVGSFMASSRILTRNSRFFQRSTNVHNAIGQARIGNDLGQFHCRQRRCLRRLQYNCVATGQRRGNFPRGHQ